MSKTLERIHIFNLATGLKDVVVDAEVIGPLAIHEKIEGDVGKKWRVTHIATGGIVVAVGNRPLAKTLAMELAALDWSAIKSADSREALKAIAPLRREILDKHGVV